jgi:hypothetical protein
MTPWTSRLLEDARTLMQEGRHRAALECLLTALSVYPDSAETLDLATKLAYLGPQAEASEPLTMDHLRDPRLDQIFCSCQEPGCTASWISAGQVFTGEIVISNPRGGRCKRCNSYFCRNHFARQSRIVQCPRCGGAIDGAPRVSNGRSSQQTARRNQPLVHVQVMREGPPTIDPDYMTSLLQAMAPDVFEDNPTISGLGVGSWPDDPQGSAMALMCARHEEYLSETYDMLFFDGRNKDGARWLLVKVFAKMPKYVDPDYPSDSRKDEPTKVSPWRSLWRRRK